MTLRHAVFLALLGIVLASCRPQEEPVSLKLPPTPILTSKSYWGVVNKPYLRVQQSIDASSPVVGVLRRGEIVEIISKVGVLEGRSYIFEIKSTESGFRGWVTDSNLDIYNSAAQARTAGSGDSSANGD